LQRIERIARLYPHLLSDMSRLRSALHEGIDLSFSQYKTLLIVADRGECSLGDLGRELEVAMSSASQMVERLVGQGLLAREQDAANRRQVNIRLTDHGRQQIEQLQQATLSGYRRLLAQLSDGEQEALVQAFETIARILGKLKESEA